MTTSNAANGRPQRKQLSDQLDRFDALLDGLSEGLNDSIADAVRDGTRLALKDAVIEILTDPNLRAKLQQAASPAVPPAKPVANKPSLWERLKAKVGQIRSAAPDAASAFAQATYKTACSATAIAATSLRGLGFLGNIKHLILVGTSVGMTVALISFFAPHAASATLAGIGGGIAAMSVQVSVWMRRAFQSMKFA